MNLLNLPLQIPGTQKITIPISRIYMSGRDRTVGFVEDLFKHAEAVSILVLATIGVGILLEGIPLFLLLPLWIEASIAIPIISVLIITFLVKLSAWRAGRRDA